MPLLLSTEVARRGLGWRSVARQFASRAPVLGGRFAMRMTIVFGIATVVLGAVLAIGLTTHAQAAAPANYSRACTEIVTSVVASDSVVEKAVLGVARHQLLPALSRLLNPRRRLNNR